MADRFRVVVKAAITCGGEILIGKKEEDPEHPIGGQWHFLGGHVEHGENLEDAVRREVEEETGLDVEVHQLVDSHTYTHNEENDGVQFLFHCEADSRDAEARDDLSEVKWIDPSEAEEELGDKESERIRNRESQSNFLEKLEKMPGAL